MSLVKADMIEKKQTFSINGNPVTANKPFEPTFIIGKHTVDIQTLEKLIEFAQSGKLDEIMSSED
ncbi:hypothetical protein [Enterococcus gallinarum]|uniref:hypothetical protein n=1 Tax=Enterococcus gallinarum TaxID=1353 RepID=UPI001F5645A3|nr:hypothetical protein [Enterococcus gallinarum]